MHLRTLTLLLLWIPAVSCYAQTSLSGTVNNYGKVSRIHDCSAHLTLEDASSFRPGMAAILIQMQGAVIDQSNSERFGDLLDPRGAGRYERVRIDTIVGNEVYLRHYLLRDYDPAGRLQLVSLPEYDAATVTDTLSAAAWNGSSGGVLALSVDRTLQLDGLIDLSGKGFRGGLAEMRGDNNCGFFTRANDYYYDRNNWRGAPKGEGIALPIADRENGRGPQGTGGGGANDHNAGGGGGANYADGGQGGENEQTGFGCDGFYPGEGGKGFTFDPERLLLGGGGGAGHENNEAGTDGGNGGGIIIILADSLDFRSGAIRTNGASPPVTTGDGGGGGGAGGTVLLDIRAANAAVPVEAPGGAGGSIDNRSGSRCHGPGGGGGGGRILQRGDLTLQAELKGGDAGLSFNSFTCPDGDNFADPGDPGRVEPLERFPRSQLPVRQPQLALRDTVANACLETPLTIAGLFSPYDTGNVRLQWQIDRGAGFTDLEAGEDYLGVQTGALTINSVRTPLSAYRYRLAVRSDCFPNYSGAITTLAINQPPMADYGLSRDERTVRFFDRSLRADQYFWQFGDGNSSEEANPEHTYATGGDYRITLIVSNACGADTLQRSLQIPLLPQADFAWNVRRGCAPLTVTFENNSIGADSCLWLFPGGRPNRSTAKNPSTVYDSSGYFGVTLIIGNAMGQDTLLLDSLIELRSSPSVDFDYQRDGAAFQFSAVVEDADSLSWDFGDGGRSDRLRPGHTYESPGQYEVVLVASNDCGADTSRQVVAVGAAPAANFEAAPAAGCPPLLVQFEPAASGSVTAYEWLFPGGEPTASRDSAPSVTYRKPGVFPVTLTVSGPLGADSLRREALVRVDDFPRTDFSFRVEGPTVYFTNETDSVDTYRWRFGDGAVSEMANPQHTYDSSGVYTVSLNAGRGSCNQAVSKTLQIVITALEGVDQRDPPIRVYPNPFSGLLQLETDPARVPNYKASLYDMHGRLLERRAFNRRRAEWNLKHLPPGMYSLKLKTQRKHWVKRIIKTRSRE